MLSLADSKKGQMYSFWDFDRVREQIGECALTSRFVVLDSCYSGSALDWLSDFSNDGRTAIDGTFVMTSSGANEPSKAPRDSRHTTFTGAILSVLNSGISGREPPEIITTKALFSHVERLCRAKGWPIPARQVHNHAGEIPLMRNAYRAPKPARRAYDAHGEIFSIRNTYIAPNPVRTGYDTRNTATLKFLSFMDDLSTAVGVQPLSREHPDPRSDIRALIIAALFAITVVVIIFASTRG
jgi:hypothetical protein